MAYLRGIAILLLIAVPAYGLYWCHAKATEWNRQDAIERELRFLNMK